MGWENVVAIIIALLALVGTVVTARASAKKNEVDALRGIIEELKNYIDDLEGDKEDLQTWAERLVCQVKEAGLEPVKFFRSERRTRPKKQE